jgi:SEC-C motif-containing protein
VVVASIRRSFMSEISETCPCCSQLPYADCCQPLIDGAAKAETAEQVMRSRYTAYVKGVMQYLYDTTHPEYRAGYNHDATKEWSENSQWKGLEILSVKGGTAEDDIGDVEFKAFYVGNKVEQTHHEVGRFRKVDGAWYFTDGVMVERMPIRSVKIGRNEPCVCGSGKKYKKCCGA